MKVNPASHSLSSGSSPEKKRARAIDGEKLRKIVHLIFVERYTLRAVADAMQVSHMTVYRALQNADIRVEGDYGKLYGKMFDNVKM